MVGKMSFIYLHESPCSLTRGVAAFNLKKNHFAILVRKRNYIYLQMSSILTNITMSTKTFVRVTPRWY